MNQISNEKFGFFLARMRKENNLTQKELADQLFVSDKAVSKWERGLSMPEWLYLLTPFRRGRTCLGIIMPKQELVLNEITVTSQ